MTQGLLNYLINAAWQVPLLVVGALALVRLGRLGPRAGNAVWLACLVLAIVLPAVRLDLAALVPAKGPVVIAEAVLPAAQPVSTAPLVDLPVPAPTTGLALDADLARLLIGAFAAAMAIGLIRLGVGWLGVRRLAREARDVAAPPWLLAEMASVAAAHGARTPQIRQHPNLAGPVVVGALRPVILVPAGFIQRPEGELRSALLHELAHVVRRDYAVNLAGELISLPLCWHPALYLIKAQARRSRELACDAMASTAMRSQTAYARGLVALAQALKAATLNSPKPNTPAIAVGLFGKPLLEERLMHLLGPRKASHPAIRTAGLAGGALLAAGAAGAAVLLHVSTAMAQPLPPAPPAPPAPRAAPPPPPAPEAPPPPPAPAMAAEPPQAPEPPAPPPALQPGGSGHRVIMISQDHGAYAHHWTAADGTSITVMNNDPKEPTADARQAIEASSETADVKVRKVRMVVDSPEFEGKLAKIRSEAVELRAQAAALRALDDPRLKAKIVEIRRTAALSANDARNARVEVVKVINDPKIRAEIAEARRSAVQSGDEARRAQIEVDKVLSDPKIKREIAEAVRVTSSPEYQKAQKDLIAAAKRLQELDRADQK